MYEQEADRVAEQIMRMSTSNHVSSGISNREERIDPNCPEDCENKKEKEKGEGVGEEKNLNVSRKPSTTSDFEARNDVTSEINNVRSNTGSPLDTATRELMEPGFGYDFRNVRIHTDGRTSETAEALKAPCIYG